MTAANFKSFLREAVMFRVVSNRTRWLSNTLSFALLDMVIASCVTSAIADEPIQFRRDIKPILSDTCFKCHGPATQSGGVRLDTADHAGRPAESGQRPIVPGDPQASEMIRRIFSEDASERMPPADSNRVLTAEQKSLLKRWVAEGAKYQKHWSFETPTRPAVPQIKAEGFRVANPIDAFLAQRLQREKLAMSPVANRETLLRRIAFALTGLPPTLDELDAFLADQDPNAVEKMIDRYLRSERFGEEMARHWLDVARYGDTHGLHLDNERQMWAYRDWVVRSFNQNKPFDQFTIEQLAGDLLPNATNDQIVATGFNRCNVTTGEGGSIDSEWVFRNAVDRTTTMVEAWLGLTAGCSVCHDHKFDPLTAKEYYSLYAFFHSAADPALDGNALLTAPTIKLSLPETDTKLADLDAKIAAKQNELEQVTKTVAYIDPATIEPRPMAETIEHIWFDDQPPAGSRHTSGSGHPPMFVNEKNGQVHRGTKALKRTDKGLAQDVFENTPPLEIPASGKLFAYVWIDPLDMPKTLMLQYFKGGWLHRGVWGDYNAIAWGKENTTERVHIGPLPDPEKWVRLEIAADTLGLKPGDHVTGFAMTQFGGTVYWDSVGVAGQSDPAADPRRSLRAWRQQQKGKDTPGLAAELNRLVKSGPEAKLNEQQENAVREFFVRTICLDTKKPFEPINKELSELRKQREDLEKSVPGSFIFRDLPKPRESFVMLRGQYDKPGEKVQPDVPSFLPPLKKNAAERASRLDLAQWIVSAENPLTARVAVNRFWQQIFGVGLVKTSYDFGSQGEMPSHPELLDWLAVEFRESGWDIKALLKLMILSEAFQQDSRVTPQLQKQDPENRLLARGPRFRLDAEQLRDQALFTSGLMQMQMGGRGVRPYQPPNIWEPVGFVGSNTARYTQDKGPSLYRRSLYTFFKRTAPPPFMVNFDAPNREQFCSVRDRSNTPLQALQLMNDVQFFEAARGLAERTLTQGGDKLDDRLAFAFRTVLTRRPDAAEIAVLRGVVEKQLSKFQRESDAAKKLIRNGESTPNEKLDQAELAAWTMIANLILNLDEAITRN